MKKNTFCFLFILLSASLNAQVRGSANLGVYRHTDFQNSGYIQGGLGLDVKVFKFLKPDFNVTYYYGKLEDHNTVNASGIVTSTSNIDASALNFGFSPKICLNSSEDGAGDAILQILPMYNISRIEAHGNYATINPNNQNQILTTNKTATEWQHSIGIGAGVDIMLSDVTYDSLAINLYYTGVDMGKAMNNVSKSENRYDSRTLGLGLNYYLGFKKRKE
ncbi:hypothetical protein [Flavobacterium hercynium]|uniref:Outer membrane protein beta-barrel domain-containing protein n=1 Tax=Flavobacterium hercynium TaxID=387094 RepID=A0A226HI92_9FLAO|nr:hypothetical protein [Flavobacterium hercynium]OXA93386.1 hypothetical protein B0A66_06825 [Flavobacterium hercynium]SMP35666.1 hypothetical protein SAMN06265346_12023 [Flavobacterium hercynium]